jgi:hypothetical protein
MGAVVEGAVAGLFLAAVLLLHYRKEKERAKMLAEWQAPVVPALEDHERRLLEAEERLDNLEDTERMLDKLKERRGWPLTKGTEETT